MQIHTITQITAQKANRNVYNKSSTDSYMYNKSNNSTLTCTAFNQIQLEEQALNHMATRNK